MGSWGGSLLPKDGHLDREVEDLLGSKRLLNLLVHIGHDAPIKFRHALDHIGELVVAVE